MSECPECGRETNVQPEYDTYGYEFTCPWCATPLEVQVDEICNCVYDSDGNIEEYEEHVWIYSLERA